MTAENIASVIIKNLVERSFPVYLERFGGGGFSESDVFGISGAGYIYEFEIKRSHSDFLADFKKAHKHMNLQSVFKRESLPTRTYDEWKKGKKTGNKVTELKMPNRFYFACEPDLIKPEELPEYCGLVYISVDGYDEIKPAKLIHGLKATEKIYKRCATILSQRVIFGCSYTTYQQREREKLINKSTQ